MPPCLANFHANHRFQGKCAREQKFVCLRNPTTASLHKNSRYKNMKQVSEYFFRRLKRSRGWLCVCTTPSRTNKSYDKISITCKWINLKKNTSSYTFISSVDDRQKRKVCLCRADKLLTRSEIALFIYWNFCRIAKVSLLLAASSRSRFKILILNFTILISSFASHASDSFHRD